MRLTMPPLCTPTLWMRPLSMTRLAMTRLSTTPLSRALLTALLLAAPLSATTLRAETRQEREGAAAATLRVSAAKTELRDRCSANAKVIGTLSRGDLLDVVQVVDANWYRVRLPGSGGAEGCVSARAVMEVPGTKTAAPGTKAPTTRDPKADAPTADSPTTDRPTRRAPPSATGTQRRQPSTAPRSTSGSRDTLGIDAFALFGTTFFTASDSFEAILDASSGPVYGAGGQYRLPFHLFARVDFTRFRKDGERVFVANGQVFKLGIPTTITVTPIEFTGGYRRELTFGRRRAGTTGAGTGGFRLIPFGGAGVGSVQYQEEADFPNAGDNVDERFTSYHIIGGVDVPVWRWIGVGAEYQHRWVPDALGTGGVSAEFDETDLGGGSFRVRIIVSF